MDENKLIMQKIVEIFNSGDLSEVDSIFSPMYIDHQKPEGLDIDGPEEFKAIVNGARKSLNNLNVTIEDIIADDKSVVARLRWHATDDSGKKIERETIDMLRIQNNKVAEHWGAEEWRKSS